MKISFKRLCSLLLTLLIIVTSFSICPALSSSASDYYDEPDPYATVTVNGITITRLPEETYPNDEDYLYNDYYSVICTDRYLSGRVTIPSSYNGYPVKEIRYQAFSNSPEITDLIIPDSVTKINYFALFVNYVTAIRLPAGLKEIPSEMLLCSYGLKYISIPAGVKSIGVSAFDNCLSLNDIIIPTGVEEIKKKAFSGCDALRSIYIPPTVTTFGEDIFQSSSAVTVYTTPGSAAYNYAVNNNIKCVTGSMSTGYCGDDISYVIFDGELRMTGTGKTIDSNSFKSNTGIEYAYLLNNSLSIGDFAFSMCTSLKSVYIPDSVTNIGMNAFSGCSALESVHLPGGLTSLGAEVLFGCGKLESIALPAGLKVIEESALSMCGGLTSLTLPDGLTDVGSGAFAGCAKLASVTIPRSVTKINDGAFYMCGALKDVYYQGLPEHWSLVTVGTMNTPLASATLHTLTIADDDVPPTGSLSATNDFSPQQTVTINLYDNLRVAGYYWMINNAAPVNNYTATEGPTATKTVNSPGQYTFKIKDANGNVSRDYNIIFYRTTFNSGGAAMPVTSVLTKASNAFILPELSEKAGHTFLGWSSTDGGTAEYNGGESFTPDSDATLYAVWKPDTYTVTFDGNGSTGGSTAEAEYTYGVEKALSVNGFTRTGYTFTGWSDDADATEAKYAAGEMISVTADTVLYAVWKLNTYTVKYDGNGADSGTVADSSFSYGEYKLLNANNFTKEGYYFLGWSTSPNAVNATYTDRDDVFNLTSAPNGVVTLYAVWFDSRVNVYADGVPTEIEPALAAFAAGEVSVLTVPSGIDLRFYTVSVPAGGKLVINRGVQYNINQITGAAGAVICESSGGAVLSWKTSYSEWWERKPSIAIASLDCVYSPSASSITSTAAIRGDVVGNMITDVGVLFVPRSELEETYGGPGDLDGDGQLTNAELNSDYIWNSFAVVGTMSVSIGMSETTYYSATLITEYDDITVVCGWFVLYQVGDADEPTVFFPRDPSRSNAKPSNFA